MRCWGGVGNLGIGEMGGEIGVVHRSVRVQAGSRMDSSIGRSEEHGKNSVAIIENVRMIHSSELLPMVVQRS